MKGEDAGALPQGTLALCLPGSLPNYSQVVMLVVARKVDVRLPGKGNSTSHGARPVHLIITMIKWIRTSRLSIKNFLSAGCEEAYA